MEYGYFYNLSKLLIWNGCFFFSSPHMHEQQYQVLWGTTLISCCYTIHTCAHIHTHTPRFVTTATLDTGKYIWYDVENTPCEFPSQVEVAQQKGFSGSEYQTHICVTLKLLPCLSVYLKLHEVIHLSLIGQNSTSTYSIHTTNTDYCHRGKWPASL